MTEQQRKSDLAKISQHLSALSKQISNSKAEMQTCVEKRNKLNEQFKVLRLEIQELKRERNDLNEKVKSIKQQRDETRGKVREIIEDLKVYSLRIKELKTKTPKENRWHLQKDLDAIEWKIQTTRLEMDEEKWLVENVKKLENQLSTYKRIDKNVEKLAELRKKLETLKANADAAHMGLTEIAKKSQGLHAKIITKMRESKNIKNDADAMHAAYLLAKTQIKPLNEEFKRLAESKKCIQFTLREEEEKRRKAAEDALKEKLESEARNKLQRGEKLSWAEFQLLTDNAQEDT